MLDAFRIPRAILPEVLDTGADFGTASPELFGAAIPIAALAGDQQAALIGQGCFKPGMIKSTYGTGAFALLNIGSEPAASRPSAADDDRLSGSMAGLPMRSRAASSSPERRCNGCAIGSASLRQRPRRRPSPRAPTNASASIWCRALPGSARRTGRRRRGLRWSG